MDVLFLLRGHAGHISTSCRSVWFNTLVLNPWRKYVASIFGYVTRNRSKPRRHFHLRKEPGRRQSNRACLDDVVRTRSMYLCRSEECIISLYRETPLRSMQCSLFPNYCLPLSIHSYQGSDKTKDTQYPVVYANELCACCGDPHVQRVSHELLLGRYSSTFDCA